MQKGAHDEPQQLQKVDEQKKDQQQTSSEPKRETTKAEVHQPDKAQRFAAQSKDQDDVPKPNGAFASAAMSAISMATLAVFMSN